MTRAVGYRPTQAVDLGHLPGIERAAGLAGLTLTTFVDVPWNGPFCETLGFRRVHGEVLNRRLRTVLAHEGDAGLPMDRRCAMGLAFRSSGEGR